MLTPTAELRIFVYSEPVDLRKAINGLSALVASTLEESPDSGDLFIFRNRRADKIKLIFWDRNGFVLYYKSLDKGRFKFSKQPSEKSFSINREQLDWLLMGFDFMTGQRDEISRNYLIY